jgi:hypothetical protein
MDTLTSMKVFRQVVESASFVAAAEHLDLSTANVSKHVMSLEKRLGVGLLNRIGDHGDYGAAGPTLPLRHSQSAYECQRVAGQGARRRVANTDAWTYRCRLGYIRAECRQSQIG